jgi:hypothetical protein
MNRQNDGGGDVKNMEHRAEEFVTLTFEMCEERLAFGRAPLTIPQKALAAAAMGVEQSIKTFLAVSKISDEAASGE